jgi:flagellar biosynthesis protein FlhB
MPNNNSGEKTEKPTPKRLEKAREEGQVARSQELNLAFSLLGSFLVLSLLTGNMINSLLERMTTSLSLSQLPDLTKANSLTLIIDTFFFIVRLIGPIMLASAVVGLIINLLQTGPIFTPKLIQPKFSKINPFSGVKRLFSIKSLVELGKSMAKALVIGVLTYLYLRNTWTDLISLTQQDIEPALVFIAGLIFRIAISIIAFLVVLGIADYIYQHWEFMKSLKMTKQEVKEEYKEYEGNPQIKSRRRQIQRKLSMNRMIKAMEEADVVITNPTQIAVALKFKIKTMEVPVVVAKGEGFIARKIREKAEEYGIKMVENRTLARALNETTEIGEEIPPALYQAVAEVLAFVYQSNRR